MNLLGYSVAHKAFGEGVIIKWDEKYVTVRFATQEKTFVYPNAFNGYMTLLDPAIMTAIQEDINAAVARQNAASEHKARERERQMRSGIVIPGSRAAAGHHEGIATEDTSEDI